MPMNPVALSSNAPTPCQSAPLSTPVCGMGFMTGLGVLVFAIFVMIINLVVDVCYKWIDPRINLD